MAHLILVRHGISEYNKRGLWTGWLDPDLIEEGKLEAREAARQIQNIPFDFAYASPLKRAKQTLSEMLGVLGRTDKAIESENLNERNYGIYAGKNKWEVKAQVGEEEFKKIRRSFDHPIPQGESLKQVYERVVPYYEKEILPKLIAGKNVLVVSSGNALRALAKHLENISDADITNLEIGTGEVYIYTIDNAGKVTNKEIRARNPKIV